MFGELDNRATEDGCLRRTVIVPDGTEEVEEKLKGAGYYHPDTEVFVLEEDAFDYALERCLRGTENDQMEFREMLVEWFYSNWKKED